MLLCCLAGAAKSLTHTNITNYRLLKTAIHLAAMLMHVCPLSLMSRPLSSLFAHVMSFIDLAIF
eukprot:m.105119 g.105119  ORF g.105119 m.105119 type:complete len:64 (-) comp13271_c0_seq2:380-571(-)